MIDEVAGADLDKSASAGDLDFAHRVLRCRVLAGLEVAAFWPEPGKVTLMARHRYGKWQCVDVTKASGGFAESDRGSVIVAGDVASRLRNMLKDKGPDRRTLPWRITGVVLE